MKRTMIVNTVLAGSLGLSCLGLAACEREGMQTDNEIGQATPEGTQDVTVEDVEESPSQFEGKQLTLAGEVSEVHGNQAFMLEGNDWIGAEEILVLTRAPIMLGGSPPTDDDDLIVEGTVRRATVAEIEREIGWDLEPQLEVELETKPILIASNIRAVDEAARWSETEEPQGTIVSTRMAYEVPDPLTLQGQKLELTGIPVQTKAGNGVWIGQSHREQTFVALPEGTDAQNINVGDRVDVTGTFREMPPAQEAMQKFGFDQTLSTQIEQEPLYVEAEQISKSQKQQPGQQAAMGQQPSEQQQRQQLTQMSNELGVEYEAQGPMVDFQTYAGSPSEYTGQGVQGQATVTEVFADHGFFVAKTQDGKETLMVIHEVDPGTKPKIHIQKDQNVRFTALVLEPGRLDDMKLPIEDKTKQVAEQQGAFLLVEPRSIQIQGQGQGQGQQGQMQPGQGQMPGQPGQMQQGQPGQMQGQGQQGQGQMQQGQQGQMPQGQQGQMPQGQ